MKELFSLHGTHVRMADQARLIFEIDGVYYNAHGIRVPEEDSFRDEEDDEDESPDRFWENAAEIAAQGLETPLQAVSVKELQSEIDDLFGLFGFRNRTGDFVIEPQYAFAFDFTCGLAAVNLNRTWYRSPSGSRSYENHYGYIDANGKTVIPFMYHDARPFNRYGTAVVETQEHSYLIDTTGSVIPGTEQYTFLHYYGYNDRYLEITFGEEPADPDGRCSDLIVGIYDTKKRKVLMEPSVEAFFDHDAFLEIWPIGKKNKFGFYEYEPYFLDENGTILFPWLLNKGFTHISPPNKALLSIVAIKKYTKKDVAAPNAERYDATPCYGLYSSKETLLLPMEYDSIREVADNIFVCRKGNEITVFAAEGND